jgi:hypothetical protein
MILHRSIFERLRRVIAKTIGAIVTATIRAQRLPFLELELGICHDENRRKDCTNNKSL